jgi:peptidoglycan hydrolase-like protein with peptidoglycan-binding domain
MTAASFAHLPLQVGGVALSHAGQAALWVIQRYMRSPLTNSAIAALVVTTAMAGSNALYGQRHEHPAPLFAPVEEVTTGSIGQVPVIPKTRPKSFATGSPVEPAKLAAVPADVPAGEPVGNKDVFEVQRKLASLNLFAGEVDGYYGPKTAAAIRKFEEGAGLVPEGQLTREVIDAILAAPVTPALPVINVPTLPAAQPAPEPVTVNLPQVKTAPVEQVLPAAEPAPQRQTLAVITQAKPLAAMTNTARTLLGRPVPASAEQAFEMAADTASDAFDTIADGVQQLAMTNPPPARLNYASGAATAAPAEPAQTLAALPDRPQVGVPLKIEEDPPKPGEAIAVLDTDATPDQIQAVSVTDPVVVAKVQRGLASLGFLHGPADGVAGSATAKAIRNFEVYFNYPVTGRISPQLLDDLIDNGAAI